MSIDLEALYIDLHRHPELSFQETRTAGVITRVRRPFMHDKFWLGADNYDFDPAVGDLAGVKAGDFKHKKLTAADGYTVKIRIARELTAGTRSHGQMFLNEVVSL